MTGSNTNEGKRRSGIAVMGALIGLVKPLLPVMLVSVTLGVIGFLCAIFLTILAGGRLVMLVQGGGAVAGAGIFAWFEKLPAGAFFACLFGIALARGVLHYGEQYCNHFIAFRLLAIIRHRVFAKLRELCPARLEGRDKGDLIAILTSDIELLEVFYAHTISPIAIATIVSVIMLAVIGAQAPGAALIAAAAYLIVGALIPLVIGGRGAQPGMKFREAFGDLGSMLLDELRGLDETIQYGCGQEKKDRISQRSAGLSGLQKELSGLEASQRSLTNLAILAASFVMLIYMTMRFEAGQSDIFQLVTATVAMMGSFGPVVALFNLANSLSQTLASGERVLRILEEDPQVEEIENGLSPAGFTGIAAENVDFSYGAEKILTDLSLKAEKGRLLGIHGASGSGKSTLLKLMMRFWDADRGRIALSGEDIRRVTTSSLRDLESYVTQESVLFHTTIAENIAVGRQGAGRAQIEEAARKASIHNFISRLPKGYDTPVGELGDTLSGGERQRIGMARAFLHDAPLLLLDEPTSNLDALNEGMILRSLTEEMKGRDKTVILVSHRLSTLGVADEIFEMSAGRSS